MDNGIESVLDMFLFETNTLIEQLDEILLNAEKADGFSSEDVNEIFRIMHTIKGSSAMMQFSSLMTVAHNIEDLFYAIRQKGVDLEYKQQLFDLMFKSNDFLKAQVEKINNGEPLDEDIDTIIGDISSILKIINGEAPSSDSQPESGSASQQQGGYQVKVFFDDGCGMENLRAFMIVCSIKDVCENFAFFPEDVETNSETGAKIIEDGFIIEFLSKEDLEKSLDVIKNALNVRTYEIFEPREEQVDAAEDASKASSPENPGQKAAPPAAQQTQPAARASDHSAAKQSLISVNLSKLNSLMDIVGEIVITEAMVTASPELQGLKLENFYKSARQLRMLTDELQNIVMSIRMVPVAGVFQKMNRIVRDIGQSLNKDVKLTVIGEETEVDKTIVDSISDPIMHMVRNAMDHGIETTAQERIEKGKPAQGEITLTAQHTGSEVVITIQDDGRGVDLNRVLAKAKENNLLTKPEAEYSKKEILQFLMMPGFSTKAEVTEFSGRGVGMDVVKKNIDKVGGTILITSEWGVGTCTTLKIPLTLAILDGMEIAVGDAIFTIPVANIRQSFKATANDISFDSNHCEMIRRMDHFYPVIRLHEIFGIPNAKTDISEGVVIWVESGDKSYGLLVDELIGEQQVVVKPVPAYLTKYNLKDLGITGCAILGDGSISIILDIVNIFDSNRRE